MIQKFIFLFVLLFQLSTFAQNLPKKVKSDSTFQMNQNEFLIYYKKKSGVYNVSTNSYSKTLSKNYLHYIPELKILVEFLPDNYVQYYLDNYFSPKEKQLNKFSQFNAEYFTNENEIIKIDKNHFIVNSFTSVISPSIPLSTVYGGDSLDANGEMVYSPSEPGKEKSGIFDMSAKKWKIQPIYGKIHVLNNYYFCQKIYNNDGFFTDSSYFDLYKKNDKNEFIFIDKIYDQENLSNLYLTITGVNAKRIHETNYYVTNINGKQGLIEFQLFWLDKFSSFYFKEYYPPNYEFVYYFENVNLLLVKNKNEYNFYKYNIDNDKLENINIKYYNNKFTFQSDYSFYEQEYFFDIEKKETFLIVKDILGEFNFLMPLLTEFGDDSLDYEGNYIYPPNEPGSYHSGIYDLNSHSWIVLPQHFYANTWNFNTFLIGNHHLNENGLLHENSQIYFDIIDKKGKSLYENLTYYEIISNPNIIKTLIGDENTNISLADINYHSNKSIPDTIKYYGSKTYLVEKNNKYQIVDSRGVNVFDFNFFNQNFNNFIFTNEKSVDFYLSFNFDLSLNTNPIINREIGTLSFYKMNEHSNDIRLEPILIAAESFELSIHYSHYSQNQNEIDAIYTLIENTDTNYFSVKIETKEIKEISKIELEKIFENNNYSRIFSIQKTPDEIVINNAKDYLIYDSNNEYFSAFDELHINKCEWQQESSTVWRKLDGKWEKVLPSFYQIHKTDFGYICETGYVKLIEEFYDEGYYEMYNSTSVVKPNKFVIFDDNLKPISLLDFYDFDKIVFYDFGYKIYLNTDNNSPKSILIGNNAKIISDKHFDEYYIENGKLVGESEELYEYDEYGDYIYGSDGIPILYQKAEKKIFENWEE